MKKPNAEKRMKWVHKLASRKMEFLMGLDVKSQLVLADISLMVAAATMAIWWTSLGGIRSSFCCCWQLLQNAWLPQFSWEQLNQFKLRSYPHCSAIYGQLIVLKLRCVSDKHSSCAAAWLTFHQSAPVSACFTAFFLTKVRRLPVLHSRTTSVVSSLACPPAKEIPSTDICVSFLGV